MFNTRGLLISLEGIDGCGKTTQVLTLQANLKRHGHDPLMVREPGGTAVGESIRQVLLQGNCTMDLQTELLLYMAARNELTGQIIAPALRSGRIVICDRFTDSTLAYQGYGGGMSLSWIRTLNHRATGGIKPRLTVLLDLPVEEAITRRGPEADRMEKRNLRYHRRVRNGYLDLARREPQRFSVLDATGAAEAQAEEIWRLAHPFICQCGEKRCGDGV